jgi:hypothetical protein
VLGNIIVRVFGIKVFGLREMLDEFDFNMNSLTFHISDSDYWSYWLWEDFAGGDVGKVAECTIYHC